MGGGPIIIIDPKDLPKSQRPKRPAKYVYRSAVTGQYVKPGYAKRYPHLTVRERVQ